MLLQPYRLGIAQPQAIRWTLSGETSNYLSHWLGCRVFPRSQIRFTHSL